jgi:hypothetical protein
VVWTKWPLIFHNINAIPCQIYLYNDTKFSVRRGEDFKGSHAWPATHLWIQCKRILMVLRELLGSRQMRNTQYFSILYTYCECQSFLYTLHFLQPFT